MAVAAACHITKALTNGCGCLNSPIKTLHPTPLSCFHISVMYKNLGSKDTKEEQECKLNNGIGKHDEPDFADTLVEVFSFLEISFRVAQAE